MAIREEIKVVVSKLLNIYEEGGHIRGQNYNNRSDTEINRQWDLLRTYIGIEARLDELFYLLGIFSNNCSRFRHELLRIAFPLCSSMEEVSNLYRQLPKSWIKERRELLRKVVALSPDKQTLVRRLEEFDVL